jgi:hypothetical protein
MKLLSPLEQMLFDDSMKIGLEKGRAEGAAALLERQLAQRFGPLSKTPQQTGQGQSGAGGGLE